MEAKNRLYFNLTNKCNVACDFCCMFSDPSKGTFIDFETFKTIVDESDGNFELQLEGGEPFLHPDFYLFIEYAKYTKRCAKIVISTNGILLKKNLQRLTDFCDTSNIPMVVKCSINYYLYNLDNNIIKRSRDLYLATEFIPNFDIRFNVRIRKDVDGWLIDELAKNKIIDYSNVYYLQNYGRMDDDTYEKPFIVKNIDNFYLYASDGKCFDQDLISRSNYEKELK